MRSVLTCVGLAGVTGLMIFACSGVSGPVPVQTEIKQAEFGVSDPMPRDEAGKPGGRANPKGRVSPANDGVTRAGFDKAVRIGDVQVRIDSLKVKKAPLESFSGTTTSAEKFLVVEVQISNANPTRKYEYKSWAGDRIALDGAIALVTDNFGNHYKRVGFGIGAKVVGAVERHESIYPNNPVSDVLVFERPLDSAKYLDIDLPARNFGGDGTFYFRIDLNAPGDRDSNPKPIVPEEPPVKPLDLELPPLADAAVDAAGDKRPLAVRRAARSKEALAAMQDRLRDFTGPKQHTKQLEAAVAAWTQEAKSTRMLMIDARDEQIAKLKPRLQAEAEAKFPTSKTDLKIRARAESQQTLYVQKKLEEETARLRAEYHVD